MCHLLGSPPFRFSPCINGSGASALIVVSGHSLTLNLQQAVVDNSDFTGKGDVTKKNYGNFSKDGNDHGAPKIAKPALGPYFVAEFNGLWMFMVDITN